MSTIRSIGRAARGGLVVVGVAAVALVLAGLTGLSLPDPFATTEKERPHSVVLAELQDLSRYTAATGRFQTIVDVEDDADYLPDFIKGERVTMMAEGDVEAYVDFSGVSASGLDISADGSSVTVTVPEPVLSDPRIDHDTSYVATRDRGLVDRFGDAVTGGEPTDDQELYQRADQKLADAAEQSDLRERARTNTEQFLTTLLGTLGYDDVTVVFETPEPSVRS